MVLINKQFRFAMAIMLFSFATISSNNVTNSCASESHHHAIPGWVEFIFAKLCCMGLMNFSGSPDFIPNSWHLIGSTQDDSKIDTTRSSSHRWLLGTEKFPENSGK